MILIVDCGSQKTKYIHQVIDEFCDAEIIPLLDLDELILKKYKGIVISGAPILITEVDPSRYLDKVQWIKTTTLPVLGICFGHQLIGMLHGAMPSKMREDRDWQLIEILEDSPIFEKLPNELELMEDHCETISIPKDFKLVASSDVCINESMQHISKPIFGVQFHPEVSGNHGKVIIENFIRITERHSK